MLYIIILLDVETPTSMGVLSLGAFLIIRRKELAGLWKSSKKFRVEFWKSLKIFFKGSKPMPFNGDRYPDEMKEYFEFPERKDIVQKPKEKNTIVQKPEEEKRTIILLSNWKEVWKFQWKNLNFLR